MPDAAVAAAEAPAEGGGWGFMRVGVIWFVVSQLISRNMQGGAGAAPAPGASAVPADVAGAALAMHDPRGEGMRLENAWQREQSMDLCVYVTETPTFASFGDDSALVWSQLGLAYTREPAEAATRSVNVTRRTSAALRANISALYAHVYVSRTGTSPDPSSSAYAAMGTVSRSHCLLTYQKPKVVKATKNLITGAAAAEPAAAAAAAEPAAAGSLALAPAAAEVGGALATLDASSRLVPHWTPTLSLSVVEDFTVYKGLRSIPPQVLPHLVYDADLGTYQPVLYVNDLWVLPETRFALNESVAELQLEIDFSVTTLVRWMMTAQMSESLKTNSAMHGEDTMDEMRRMLIETSPVLLGVTMLVSILHTVFDMLAFKNDISFWKDNKSMKGLSFQSMTINLFFQAVIFLYLCDNETSWMILMSTGVGLAIEV